MHAARALVRRTPLAAATLRTAIGGRSIASPSAAVCYHRSFAAAAAQQQQQQVEEVCIRTEENVDMVRNAICKMLAKDEETDAKPISNEELEQNLASFANRFEEARACMNDCEEAKAGSLEFYEELYTAQKAVDESFHCYVDLLDDFRRASDDQIKTLCQDRLALARALKALRQQVHQLAEPQQQKKPQRNAA